jgi:hypothetical protein
MNGWIMKTIFINSYFSLVARLGIWICLVAAPARSPAATMIYSNFGTGSYNISQGNPVGNAFDGNDYAEGDTFVLSGDAIFDSLRIALSCFGSCTDPFLVTLTRDAGNQPGPALETFTIPSGALGTMGTSNPPLVLNSVVGPALSSGTRYWITVRAGLNDSIDWNLNSSGDAAAEAISSDAGATWFSPSGNTPGAFEVRGIVAEPGGLGFMLSAGLLFGLGAARKVRQPKAKERDD